MINNNDDINHKLIIKEKMLAKQNYLLKIYKIKIQQEEIVNL